MNDAVGVVGLHGLDTLYAFMIKNHLQLVQVIFKNNQDKIIVSHSDFCSKNIEQITTKGIKVYNQLAEVLTLIGTLQIIRKHIAYQLNTSCKFDSAHLEATLKTFNE